MFATSRRSFQRASAVAVAASLAFAGLGATPASGAVNSALAAGASPARSLTVT